MTLIEERLIPTLASRTHAPLAPAAPKSAVPLASPSTPTLLLQSGAPGALPVFCLPGAGANISCFLPLTQALGAQVPCIGVQGRGMDGEAVPHTSVEAAAQACLKDLRAHCPRGPYQLLGHSFGGWLAFELGRCLHEAGEAVAPLILVDCEPPGTVRQAHGTALMLHFIELLELDHGCRLPLEAAELEPLDEPARIERLLRALITAQVLPTRTPPHELETLLRVFEANFNTVYQPASPYPGAVCLIYADPPNLSGLRRMPALELPDPVGGWRSQAPQLEVQHLAGTHHMNILKPPHVDRLAAAIRHAWSLASLPSAN